MTTYTANLGKEGRILIPAPIRQQLGLHSGQALSLSVVDGEVRISSPLSAICKLQERMAGLKDPDTCVVDSFLRERRESAAGE